MHRAMLTNDWLYALLLSLNLNPIQLFHVRSTRTHVRSIQKIYCYMSTQLCKQYTMKRKPTHHLNVEPERVKKNKKKTEKKRTPVQNTNKAHRVIGIVSLHLLALLYSYMYVYSAQKESIYRFQPFTNWILNFCRFRQNAYLATVSFPELSNPKCICYVMLSFGVNPNKWS